MPIRKIFCAIVLSAGCVGAIEDPSARLVPGATASDAGGGAAGTLASSGQGSRAGAAARASLPTPTKGAGAGAAAPTAGWAAPTGATAPAQPQRPATTATASTGTFDPKAPNASGASVGVGSLSEPALGPAPTQSSKVPRAPVVLVKNWDFGADGTIKGMDDLIAEFQFHDQFNTIANGTNYGSVTVAPTSATAIAANNLGLPNNRQPVEDPARPYREFSADAIKTYVLPLSPTATTVSASAHNTGNGSFTAKWTLPGGGSRLKQDLLWESRVRIPMPAPAFWFSLWTAGTKWNKGAEMDVVESFGTPNIGTGAKAFHVNSVGGTDKQAFSNWPNTLTSLGVPMAARDLSQWHVFTWVYLRDDTYQVYFDDYLVQQGTLLWTLSGTASAQPIDMYFLFDLSWGHTQVQDVNISLPASSFPISYELDYSRVYMRQ